MEKQVTVGKVSNSIEELEKLCNEQAERMVKTITTDSEVSFWTADIRELICIAKFCKGADGNFNYALDFSLSTL